MLATSSFFFSEKRPNVTIFLPKVCPVFQQFRTKKVVDIPLGNKCITAENSMYYLRKFSFFRSETFVFTMVYLPLFLSEMVEIYPFRQFSVENTIVYREEFSKVKHSNYACYIVLFLAKTSQM